MPDLESPAPAAAPATPPAPASAPVPTRPPAPITLLAGDADDLVELLRAGMPDSAVATDVATARRTGQRADFVVLAVRGDGRRSALIKATELLNDIDDLTAPDVVRAVIIESRRARMAPEKLHRLLAREVLFQISSARPQGRGRERSFRQHLGRVTLESAGLRVIRFA